MRMLKTDVGPFAERPFYEQKEIESITAMELRSVELLPRRPSPIRVDRFLEKRFGLAEDYADLPAGILGYTQFGSQGAEAVMISRSLEEEGGVVAKRRIRTTLAHEAGHILLHAHLFVIGDSRESARPFSDEFDARDRSILCRDSNIEVAGGLTGGYDGRWWEYQANQAMGALLLPKALVLKALDGLLVTAGVMGIPRLDASERLTASESLSTTFDVNPVVARHRLDQLFPVQESAQLTF